MKLEQNSHANIFLLVSYNYEKRPNEIKIEIEEMLDSKKNIDKKLNEENLVALEHDFDTYFR